MVYACSFDEWLFDSVAYSTSCQIKYLFSWLWLDQMMWKSDLAKLGWTFIVTWTVFWVLVSLRLVIGLGSTQLHAISIDPSSSAPLIVSWQVRRSSLIALAQNFLFLGPPLPLHLATTWAAVFCCFDGETTSLEVLSDGFILGLVGSTSPSSSSYHLNCCLLLLWWRDGKSGGPLWLH